MTGLRPERRWIALVAGLILGVAACTSGGGSAPSGAEPPVPKAARPARGSSAAHLAAGLATLTKIAQFDGLATSATGLPGGHELLVTMRAGQVYRITLETRHGTIVPVPDPHPLLDLSALTTNDGERGLLSAVIAPKGNVVYLDYTARDGTVTVAGYPYRPGAALHQDQAWTVLAVPHPTPGHNGGDLTFADDGQLLVSLGDRDIIGPGLPVAQDPSSPLGGIVAIRLDPAGRRVGPPIQLAKGMRNPWRIAVDPDTGTIWAGDVGEDSVEEVDTVPPVRHGTVPNYGWPIIEGNVPGPRTDLTVTDPVAPVFTRRHRNGVCAMVGGAVYRGLRLPKLYGAYVYGDLCSSELRAFTLRDGKPLDDTRLAVGPDLAIALGVGPQGEIYETTVTGAVYRLDPATTPSTATPTTVPSSDQSSKGKSTPQCRVTPTLNAFGALVDRPATKPAAFKAALNKLVALLAAQPATGPADLQHAMKVLRQSFTLEATQAAAVGWNPQDPAVKAFVVNAQNGHDPVPGFLAAIEVVDAFTLAHCS